MATDAAQRASRSDRAALRRLAKALRVFTKYDSSRHGVVEASDEALMAVITSLGYPIKHASEAGAVLDRVEAERSARRLEPITVAWIGSKSTARLRLNGTASKGRVTWSIRTEDGRTIDGSAKVADLRTVERRTPTGTRARFATIPPQ